jgi:phage tail sheath protein FI
MPVAVSYPGVYVEEIPSGVRTITGVATSITVFVGWAARGPTDRAELVLSWTDFERKFGGLDNRSYLGYSVYHFFNNGGSKAYVLRLVAPDSEAAAVTLNNLRVTANSKGDWGESYAIVTKKRADKPTRFRLVVANIKDNPKGIPVEIFEDLSMQAGDPRYAGTVLQSESNLIKAEPVDANVTTPPDDTELTAEGAIPDSAKLTGGELGTVWGPEVGDFRTKLKAVASEGDVLDQIDLFNLLCVPGLTDDGTIQDLQDFCRARRAFFIADAAESARFDNVTNVLANITGDDSINSAFYFPWVLAPDDLQEGRPRRFPPCGFVAGIYARTDATRGVWKAPAGTDASLTGALGVDPINNLTDNQNGVLNPQAVNCIRKFPVYGTIVWGARTLQGNDERGSEWKYVPVRRTALYIEESLYRALKWVVFEPNDEPLWAQIRLNVGAFMHDMFRQGAFQGVKPKDAYFVKCDKETTTQSDVNRGIVNIVVGFAPLKPAEFVIIKLQQMAGQIEV